MHKIADAHNLTEPEQELIRAAVGNQGMLEVAVRAETHGRAVVAGRKKFFDPTDRAVAEHYISLLARLKELELVHEANNKKAYELTNFGWQLSRNLGRSGPQGPAVQNSSAKTPPAISMGGNNKSENPMSATATLDRAESLVSALGLDDTFQPQEPSTLKDTGLSEALIEDLVLKFLSGIGSESGRTISDNLCLPMAILEDRFTAMRNRQEIAPSGSAMLGDHVYRLTDVGRDRALRALRECAYVGPTPVPLEDYVSSVHAQTISSERPRKTQLERAFSDIHVAPEMLSQLGPAINAGKGMFIYGPPGNGKTTIAQRITRCFGQNILIPHAIVEGGKIIKMYDASCHRAVRSTVGSLFRTAEFDRRWIRIERPTVVVGGELTMDSLELKHDPVSNVSEASLQMKSNCGCLLIDDFGRQRINPTELLNRWIIPLENRIDYLSLSNGRKIEVPFEQLIIFSTNLEPHDLADDAFLRRIPFKVEVGDPSPQEFHLLFQIFAKKHQIECPAAMVDYLIRAHYQSCARPLRRCQARDLLEQVVYYCSYNELPLEITEEYLDHAVRNYFTALKGD